ncbi:uncharacterized protein, partial [Aegilops tauschii subsp. strangulata]|uniref:uncharacterized protein n=1 Tax=Aegilops tauschii subsp. strangulata TaxID=200361 RepID=UPI003CC88871
HNPHHSSSRPLPPTHPQPPPSPSLRSRSAATPKPVDVVLWRRGRADLSALLPATAVASGYTVVSLAADVLLLLLAVLYAWSRAARLLGHPAPPIPDLQPAADELAALIRSGLASAFRRVAQGPPGSGRVFACLAAAALLARLARDLPTWCYTVVVGAGNPSCRGAAMVTYRRRRTRTRTTVVW